MMRFAARAFGAGLTAARDRALLHGWSLIVFRKMVGGWLHVAAALLLCVLAGCQTTQVPMNTPLLKDAVGAPHYAPGYTLPAMLQARKDHVLLALAFSGGGKRSAAFAHGVLRGLKQMNVTEGGRTHPLLDDVTYIAAVSGGSFPAMHYGLFGNKSFETFEAEFLKRDINAFIWGIYLLPWNWEWVINPLFGTNDAMAAVYDRLMFHGATYGDLAKQGLPMISVNATDIAGGISFPFNQTVFDLLCSDLSTFPVARAVAASNGFPILFSPVTITSFRRGCLGHPPPAAPPQDWAAASDLSRRAVLARNAERYLDPERTHYVHLMDGGIADNLALRTLTNALISLDDDAVTLHRIASGTTRLIVISVDGQAATNPTLGQQRVVTGLGQIFSAVSGTKIDSFNFETLLLATQQVDKVTDTIRDIRCRTGGVADGQDCRDVQGALIHLSLADIQDAETRQRLQAIPTGLTIPDADVDALIAAGERLVQTNPKLLSLVSDLDGRTAMPVAAAVTR